MELSIDYLAVVANSTLRMMTPILLVTLAAAICTKVRIFNIAMEGTMLTGAFSVLLLTIILIMYFYLFLLEQLVE